MAVDKELVELTEDTNPTSDDLVYVVDSPATTKGNRKVSLGNLNKGVSPLTTKGDLMTYSTGNIRLGVGTDGFVLTADSAEASGIKWAAAPSGGHTIKDEGTPLTQRAGLNFVGALVTATDDAGNNETDVTVSIPSDHITDSMINSTGITTRSKLPAALAYEDEVNAFVSGQDLNNYFDINETSLPLAPATGKRRIFYDSTRNTIGMHSDLVGPLTTVYAARQLDDLTDVNIPSGYTDGQFLIASGPVVNSYAPALLTGDVASVTTSGVVTLNSIVAKGNKNNSFGAFYQDISEIAAPTNPTAGTRRIFVNSATGKLSVRTSGGTTVSLEEGGGGSQTPWTQDIDADGFDLTDLSNLEFRNTTGAPAGTVPSLWADANGITLNVPTADLFSFTVNGNTVFTFSETAIGVDAAYVDLSNLATPANPPVGTRRMFVDSGTGELSVRTSGGTTVSLEGAGGGSQTPWTSNIDAAGFDLSNLGYLTMNEKVTPTPPAANKITLYAFDRAGRNTLRYITPSGFETQLAQDSLLVCRNSSGVTLNAGDVVYADGSQSSDRPKVFLAQANAENTSNVLGVAAETIANAADGFIMLQGNLFGVNTSAFNDGDYVWLSSSVAGGLTNTEPTTPPNYSVFIGQVTKKAASGILVVNVATVKGNLTGTNKSAFTVGSTGDALAREIKLTNSAGTITLSGDATANRTITVPDATGTLALTTSKLSDFAATTSAELATVISDETGSGLLVFGTSPTLTTPILGTPASGTLTNCTALPVGGLVAGTKGDLIASTGSVRQALGVGTNNQVLIADSTTATGLRWGDASAISQPATYYAIFDRIAPAANKYMATLFNTSATRKVVIHRIWYLNWQVALVTGVSLEQYLARITARTAGTSITIRPADTSDSLSSGITGDHNTSAVTEDYIFKRFFATGEEAAGSGGANVEDFFGSDWNWQLVYRRWEGIKGIVLRQNQGVSVRNVTSSTVGTCSYMIEFTDEAA